MRKYFVHFDTIEDLAGWAPDDLKDEEIICASYDHAGYEGWAFCLYVRDGKLYEVHDSHCSCHGLENWEPEETSFDAVLMRRDLEADMRKLIEDAKQQFAPA